MGVLIVLELGSGSCVRPSMEWSKELDCTSSALASGSGESLIRKPFLSAAGVVILPGSRPDTWRVRLAVALFSMGVNSFFALGLRIVASGLRGVRAPPIFLKSSSRPAGAWKDSSLLCERSNCDKRVASPCSVRGVSGRKFAIIDAVS